MSKKNLFTVICVIEGAYINSTMGFEVETEEEKKEEEENPKDEEPKKEEDEEKKEESKNAKGP